MSSLVISSHDGAQEPLDIPQSDCALPLHELLARHGHPLNTRCGARGKCNGCTVTVKSGQLLNQGSPQSAPGTVKACQCHLSDCSEPLTLQIPTRSRLRHAPEVATDFVTNIPIGHAPIFTANETTTHALAIDLGTTTVVACLVSLETGDILARESDFNAQTKIGDNVLTRIQHCQDHPDTGLVQLQHILYWETIIPLIARLCKKQKVAPDALAGAVIAANTTMLHTFAGVDPIPMGKVPFTPGFLEHTILPDSNLRASCPRDRFPCEQDTPDSTLPDTFLWHLLPGMAAYVGADISAGVFSTGMHYETHTSLLVDVGTNGEIVLRHNGKLLGCATAAGPAFEGAGLHHGTRAMKGAVSSITIQASPLTISAQLIGNAAHATGICGTAYIDFLAEGFRSGLLTAGGRFNNAVYDPLPDSMKAETEYGRAIVIAPGEHEPILINEADIALLLQAKAAIGAGIVTLLQRAGIEANAVNTVYLAGGFGLHMNTTNAIDAGLLPGFKPEQVKTVGNTSLGGAWMSLNDQSCLDEITQLASDATIVELNKEPNFEDNYIDQLTLDMEDV